MTFFYCKNIGGYYEIRKSMEKLFLYVKVGGIIYPGSEIYGGLANTWDYGPLGVEFKNNVKKAWWKNLFNNLNIMLVLIVQS